MSQPPTPGPGMLATAGAATSTPGNKANAVDELRRAVLFRAQALEEMAQALRGPLGTSRQSLRDALDIVEAFPGELLNVMEAELSRAIDDDNRVARLTAYLNHINSILDLLESHFAHGTRRELSVALVEEVASSLKELGLSSYGVVLSHGEAYNYSTSWGDIAQSVFKPIQAAGVSRPPASFALFKVPRFEGAGVQWRPVLLGHEVAHVGVAERDAVNSLDLPSKFDFAHAGDVPNPRARPGADTTATAAGLYEIATNWATELLCDAYALRAFGPAAIAAMAEFFVCIGALDRPSPTHPPGWLRIKLLFDQIGQVSEPRLDAVLEPWREQQPSTLVFSEPWAQSLADLFGQHAQAMRTVVDTFPGARYDFNQRTDWILEIATDLAAGLPGREMRTDGATLHHALSTDVVNAVWLARREDAPAPIDRLGQKTIEAISFVEKWMNSGGTMPLDLTATASQSAGVGATDSGVDPGEAIAKPDASAIALSGLSLTARLRMHGSQGLVVRPLLHAPQDSGVDLRLGTRFIVFRRTGISSFDPLDLDNDPRAIQNYVELAHSERFVLHPQEIVLGATMEYLSMPDDVSGQVITRSSYGRLGMLTATAVQVHARFRGCLTLELANLSTIPIVLTPGERIAQLILWKSEPSAVSPDRKYDCPIGPEFSRVREDDEANTLRALRQPKP